VFQVRAGALLDDEEPVWLEQKRKPDEPAAQMDQLRSLSTREGFREGNLAQALQHQPVAL